MGYIGKIKDSSGTTHLVASTLFGTCSTAIGTAAKVVTCSNFSQLENGVTIHVYFVNGNIAASPTLNVNSTGAIAIKRYSTTAPQCSTQNWAAGQIVSFTYYEVSSTDKRWVMNDIDQRFDLLTGTGEAAQDKGAGVSPRYFPAKWKFNLGKQPQDGDIITIRIPCAGHTNGVYISLDNGTNYKPVSVNNTDRLTTNYANGKTITLVYESSGQTKDMYNINGGDIREDITGGCWTVLNYYNTNNSVTQTNTTGNASYRVLFSNTADNTTRTEAARKSVKLQFNPSTCTLQLYNESTTATNAPATILFSMKDTTTGKTYNGGYIKVYQDHGATPNGDNMVINSGGGMFLGSGESPSSHYSAKGSTYTGEDCFITADGSLHLQANGNTIANRKGLQITNGFALVPEQADVATDNVGSIGTSSYRWANGYFTKINGVTPVLTDTTYTFEDGTNGFTVITNGSGVQAVTVTPSIADNITGSGTSGYLAKFNGTNTITSGPQLGSDTTTYLRNDGTWTTPVDTKNTAGSNNSTSSLYLIGATGQTTESNGVQTYSNSGLVYDGTSHTLKIGTGNEIGTIQLQAGNTVLYNTIIPGLNTQPISHTLPSSSGTLINNTDYNNNRELQIYESLDSTMGQDSISENITNIRDKIKYIDIFFTDNNFHKGWSGGLNIISENYGHLRIPYDQISKDPVSDSTRFSLFLFGDENSYYLRKRTYYVYETENSPGVYTLNIAASGNNKDLVIQFYGTPGTGSWGNMTVRAMYSIGIKIYRVKLILDL